MRVFTCVLVTLVGLAAVPNVNSQCLSEDIQKNTEYKYKSRNLYKGLTIFTEKFLEAMYKANPNENLFFSPFSLYHALLLAYFGSANQTEKVLKVSSLKAAKMSPAKSFIIFRKHSNCTGQPAKLTSSKVISTRRDSVSTMEPMHRLNFRQWTDFTSPTKLC